MRDSIYPFKEIVKKKIREIEAIDTNLDDIFYLSEELGLGLTDPYVFNDLSNRICDARDQASRFIEDLKKGELIIEKE
tara:strand:+ start:647 stop:880 length:234 start_codon:yes stop_codon:yes gene_type:complete